MSLFPEVDKEIEEIKAKEQQSLQDLIDSSEMYRPSNGTEGCWFHENFCAKCSKDDEEKDLLCETMAMLLGGDSENVRIKNDYIFCIKDSNFDLKETLREVRDGM